MNLSFRLINDSDQILDSATASWTLVIDDREVPDRGGGATLGTFKEDRLEEGSSRTSSKTTPKPPMRAVDTLNLLATKHWRLDPTP